MPSQNETRLLRLRLVMAEYQERVGARIKTERRRHGWSQNELASRIPGKTDGATVGRWERGKVFPRPNTLDAIAQALEVDPAVLLAEDREDPGVTADRATTVTDTSNGLTDHLGRLERKLDVIVEILTEGGSITEHATIDIDDTDEASRRFAETVRREAQNTRARQQAEAGDPAGEDAAGAAS